MSENMLTMPKRRMNSIAWDILRPSHLLVLIILLRIFAEELLLVNPWIVIEALFEAVDGEQGYEIDRTGSDEAETYE